MNFWREMFSAKSGMASSKRVVGVLVWLVILAMYIYCTITGTASSDLAEWLIIAASSLLGVDSVANIFRRNNNKTPTNSQDSESSQD